VLAIVLVVVLFMGMGSKDLVGPEGEKYSVLSEQKAADTLVGFLNQVYSDRVGVVTMNSVSQEHGLYKVAVTIDSNNNPVDGDLYVSKDGQLFFPTAVRIDDILADVNAQGDASITDPNAAETVEEGSQEEATENSEVPEEGDDENTNSEDIDEEESTQ